MVCMEWHLKNSFYLFTKFSLWWYHIELKETRNNHRLLCLHWPATYFDLPDFRGPNWQYINHPSLCTHLHHNHSSTTSLLSYFHSLTHYYLQFFFTLIHSPEVNVILSPLQSVLPFSILTFLFLFSHAHISFCTLSFFYVNIV